MSIFSHLKLCVAVARHNFKWVKIKIVKFSALGIRALIVAGLSRLLLTSSRVLPITNTLRPPPPAQPSSSRGRCRQISPICTRISMFSSVNKGHCPNAGWMLAKLCQHWPSIGHTLSTFQSLAFPANTGHPPNVSTMLGQRRRQWTSTVPTLAQKRHPSDITKQLNQFTGDELSDPITLPPSDQLDNYCIQGESP